MRSQYTNLSIIPFPEKLAWDLAVEDTHLLSGAQRPFPSYLHVARLLSEQQDLGSQKEEATLTWTYSFLKF